MSKFGRWVLGVGLLLAPSALWATELVASVARCCGCPFCCK